MIEKEKYLNSIKSLLKKIDREKVESGILSDYIHKKIDNNTYTEALNLARTRGKSSVNITKYSSIEEFEKSTGVKIEGHKYRKIEGLELDEI